MGEIAFELLALQERLATINRSLASSGQLRSLVVSLKFIDTVVRILQEQEGTR